MVEAPIRGIPMLCCLWSSVVYLMANRVIHCLDLRLYIARPIPLGLMLNRPLLIQR